MKTRILFYVCGDEYEVYTYYPDEMIESFNRNGIKAA